MPSVFAKNARVLIFRLLPLVFFSAGLAADGDATTPLSLSDQPSTAAASVTTPPPPDGRRRVILLGDRPTVAPSGQDPVPQQLATTAGLILKAEVSDETSAGATLADVQKQAASIVARRPAAVLLFAGPPDEAAQTADEQQIYTIQSFARALTAANIQLFVLPASTGVGAVESAILRIATTGVDPRVSYVDLGGELGGRPFEEALEQLLEKLDNPPAATDTTPPPPSEMSLPRETPPTTSPGTPDPDKGTPTEKKQPGTSLPPALTGTSDAEKRPASTPEAEETTTGRVRRTGPEATPATIQMPAPPPLKQFSPRRPAPNKPNEKKQPSFSR